MSKHTPGPWVANVRKLGAARIEAPGRLVGFVSADETIEDAHGRIHETTSAEAKANARLIAAAPDLLEALLHIVNDTPEPGEDAELTVIGYNKACAAIAKARGE